MGEIELSRDAERLLVVQEVTAEALAKRLVERLFACVAERRVAGVVPEPDRLDEVFVEPQGRATTREIAVVSSVCVMRVR